MLLIFTCNKVLTPGRFPLSPTRFYSCIYLFEIPFYIHTLILFYMQTVEYTIVTITILLNILFKWKKWKK